MGIKVIFNKNKTSRLFAFLAAVLCLSMFSLGCARPLEKTNSIDQYSVPDEMHIYGIIRHQDGSPYVGEVHINGQDNTSNVVTTDENGFFFFEVPSLQIYVLAASVASNASFQETNGASATFDMSARFSVRKDFIAVSG